MSPRPQLSDRHLAADEENRPLPRTGVGQKSSAGVLDRRAEVLRFPRRDVPMRSRRSHPDVEQAEATGAVRGHVQAQPVGRLDRAAVEERRVELPGLFPAISSTFCAGSRRRDRASRRWPSPPATRRRPQPRLRRPSELSCPRRSSLRSHPSGVGEAMLRRDAGYCLVVGHVAMDTCPHGPGGWLARGKPAAARSGVAIRVCSDGTRVDRDGSRQRRRAETPRSTGRLVFAYLVAEHGRPVTRDELAEALWGDELPTTWVKALTVLVGPVKGRAGGVRRGRRGDHERRSAATS